jgi:hypothetical protein
MLVPFHAVLRDDPRPREPDSERALLERRLALADEERRRQQPGRASCGGSRSGAERTIAPLRVVCAVSLMLVALCAVTVKASAMPGSWPQATATSSGEMRSGGSQMAAYGSQFGHLAGQPSEVSDHASYAFNWTDASVGAGVTAVLGLIAGAAVLRLSRRRMHGQIAG